jgi:pyridoxamine 5'-phosphate oxidase
MSIYNQRIDYSLNDPLEISVLPESPFELFEGWYKVAIKKVDKDPNAMVLSTYANGTPRGRVVLLKSLDERGFTYFTNYNSDKAQETNAHEKASLTFFWPTIERQVRVEGIVERVSEEDSDEYFNNRPLGSRLGAWASPQSKEIKNREELIDRLEVIKEQFKDKEVVRPNNWGGLRLVPTYFEFWQGQSSRLHDRIVFEKTNNGWVKKRLAP